MERTARVSLQAHFLPLPLSAALRLAGYRRRQGYEGVGIDL